MGCPAAVHPDFVTAGLHGGGVGECVLVATGNGETQGLVAAKSKRPLVHDRPALPSIGWCLMRPLCSGHVRRPPPQLELADLRCCRRAMPRDCRSSQLAPASVLVRSHGPSPGCSQWPCMVVTDTASAGCGPAVAVRLAPLRSGRGRRPDTLLDFFDCGLDRRAGPRVCAPRVPSRGGGQRAMACLHSQRDPSPGA